MFGLDCGATILGILFDAVGACETLAIYGGLTAFMLIIFFLYIKNSKDVINEYEKLPNDKCEYDEKCQDDGNDDGDNAGNEEGEHEKGNTQGMVEKCVVQGIGLLGRVGQNEVVVSHYSKCLKLQRCNAILIIYAVNVWEKSD